MMANFTSSDIRNAKLLGLLAGVALVIDKDVTAQELGWQHLFAEATRMFPGKGELMQAVKAMALDGLQIELQVGEVGQSMPGLDG